jgi:hypothetical protein
VNVTKSWIAQRWSTNRWYKERPGTADWCDPSRASKPSIEGGVNGVWLDALSGDLCIVCLEMNERSGIVLLEGAFPSRYSCTRSSMHIFDGVRNRDMFSDVLVQYSRRLRKGYGLQN